MMRCIALRLSSADESRVDVGPVDHGVAADAGLHLGRSGVHAMNGSSCNGAMALVAHLVDIGNIQQTRVL